MSSIAERNRVNNLEARVALLEARSGMPALAPQPVIVAPVPPFEVKRSFGQYAVIDGTNDIIFTAKTKAEAQAHADGLAV